MKYAIFEVFQTRRLPKLSRKVCCGGSRGASGGLPAAHTGFPDVNNQHRPIVTLLFKFKTALLQCSCIWRKPYRWMVRSRAGYSFCRHSLMTQQVGQSAAIVVLSVIVEFSAIVGFIVDVWGRYYRGQRCEPGVRTCPVETSNHSQLTFNSFALLMSPNGSFISLNRRIHGCDIGLVCFATYWIYDMCNALSCFSWRYRYCSFSRIESLTIIEALGMFSIRFRSKRWCHS